MDQLSRTAKAYYNGGSRNDRESAQRFFRSLDSNGDGLISQLEFLGFMSQHGHPMMNNSNFFHLLDRNRNGALDFWEVMTLYYIIKSGRPFCAGCRLFITAQFFACVECFSRNNQGCCICISCYEQGNFRHHHNRSYFYDNFTLLEIKRMEPPRNRNQLMQQQASTSQAIQAFQPAYPTNFMPLAMVPAANRRTNKWSVALRAFESSLAIGGIVTNLCTIL